MRNIFFIGTTIVSRLRLVFLLLFLLLLLLSAIYSFTSFQITKTQKTVVQKAIPELVSAHLIETEFRELQVLLDDFRTITQVEQIASSRGAVESKLNSIKEGLTAIQSLSGEGSNLVSSPTDILENLEKSVATREQFQLGLINAQSNLRNIIRDLEQIKDNMGESLQPHLLDLSVELENLLSDQSDSINSIESTKALSYLVDTSSTLSLLLNQNNSALDMAISLADSPASPGNAERIRQLKFALHRSAEEIIYLDYKNTKSELAEFTGNIYKRSFSSAGITDNLEAYRQSIASYEKAEISETQLITELSGWIEKKLETTVAEVQNSSTQFRKKLNAALVSTIVISVIVVALIWFVNLHILERQIHQRMSSLTNSVLAIAAQDTDHQIVVDGEDEIGEIANSLKIFRSNLLELRRSNSELQQFAYAASHDLRSPLTAVSSLADWIIEDSLDDLSDESKVNLLLLRGRINRLATLQLALLEYAQAGTGDQNKKSFSPHTMVADIAELLDPENNFNIKCDSPLQQIETHWTPLNQIIHNLVNNAIKHHDKVVGNIVVRVNHANGRLNISVEDDGPGIEKRFQSEVFKLFTRLQSQDVIEGSGMGLSLVKKLIDRYGAKITITSDPDIQRGTTLEFTWPCDSVSRIPG